MRPRYFMEKIGIHACVWKENVCNSGLQRFVAQWLSLPVTSSCRISLIRGISLSLSISLKCTLTDECICLVAARLHHTSPPWYWSSFSMHKRESHTLPQFPLAVLNINQQISLNYGKNTKKKKKKHTEWIMFPSNMWRNEQQNTPTHSKRCNQAHIPFHISRCLWEIILSAVITEQFGKSVRIYVTFNVTICPPENQNVDCLTTTLPLKQKLHKGLQNRFTGGQRVPAHADVFRHWTVCWQSKFHGVCPRCHFMLVPNLFGKIVVKKGQKTKTRKNKGFTQSHV